MKLIKDLGTRLCGRTRPMTKRFGLYECPGCTRPFETRTSNVKSGNTTKCASCSSKLKKTTHGKAYHPLYSTWKCMLDRTLNPRSTGFKNYGGRGITVCEAWRNDISSFIEWAELQEYKADYTLDRINVNGDYEPKNCRFTNPFVQGQNTRRLSVRNKSGFRGVSFDTSRGKWQAHVKSGGTNHALGRFDEAEDAARAYDQWVIENKTEHPINFNLPLIE